MKKRLLILSVLALFLSASTRAYDFNVDGIYYNITSDSEAQVTYRTSSYNSYSGEVVIPETITYDGETYTVTSIGSSAFRDSKGLTGISLPEGMTSIGNRAFYGCTSLTEITIPNSVTELGNNAFYNCTGLKQVIIGDGVTEISTSTFAGCTELAQVSIPNSVTSIGEYAFMNCAGLTQVTIPNSVVELGNYAFQRCYGLNEITIPYSVTTIGSSAFYDCTALTNLILEDGEETLSLTTNQNNTTFNNCPLETIYLGRNLVLSNNISPFVSITETASVTIGSEVTKICNYSFYNCEWLAEINFTNNIDSIGNSAFRGCTGLTGDLIIPDGVQYLGSSAFRDCSNLSTVTIGEGVTAIGDNAFYQCEGLTNVTIGNSVSIIGTYAFYGCANIEDVALGNSVDSIANYAFYNCSSISELKIPASVKYIDQYSFGDCSNIKKLIFNDGVETLTLGTGSAHTTFGSCPIETIYLGRNLDYSRSYCPIKDITTLTSLTIGNCVTKLGYDAFAGCTGLTEINIPTNVTELGGRAFKECTGLSGELVIHDRMETIGSEAFMGCTGLTGTLRIPKSVMEISSAFIGCTGFKSLVIEDSSETLTALSNTLSECAFENIYWGRNLEIENDRPPFNNTTGPTSLVIGDCVTYISVTMFKDADWLVGEVTIPNSVTEIGIGAFQNCTGLTQIILPNSLTTIESSTFYGCSSITSIVIPSSVTYIGMFAFRDCQSLIEVILEDGEEPLKIYTSSTYSYCPFYGSPLETLYLGRDLEYETNLTAPFKANYGTLKYLTIGERVTSIGWASFDGFTKLEGELKIPNSVTTISSYAFRSCSSLKEVTIGNGTTSIGYDAFHGCTALESVTSLNPEPPTCGTSCFYNVPTDSCTLYVPKGSRSDYRLASQWRDFENIVEIDVEVDAIDDITINGNGGANGYGMIVGYYTTDGKQVPSLRRGVNIIRFSDGTAKKVLVK